jgi:hypothetical protein
MGRLLPEVGDGIQYPKRCFKQNNKAMDDDQNTGTVEPEKQRLVSNGCITCDTGVTVGSHVFCAAHAEAI